MQYEEQAIDSFKKIDTSSWNTFKDDVFIRLINKKIVDNVPEYENVIRVPFMDLYKVYYIREIDRTKDKVFGYTLHKNDMKRFNTKFKKINMQAQYNHNNDKKMRVYTFKESMVKSSVLAPVIKMHPHAMMMADNNAGTIIDKDENGNENVLMVTNSMGVFGTSYMASNVMVDIYRRFKNNNFYMASLSQHQMMCINESYLSENGRKNRNEYEDDLFGMIDKINAGFENWMDILSYRLYYFMGDDGMKIISIKET